MGRASEDVDCDAQSKSLPPCKFVNPIAEGADPWVVLDPTSSFQRYLWCFSEGNRAIAIHVSYSLTKIGRKFIVWTAPDEGPYSREVWAPELHFIHGRWYIYFCASDGENANHLAYVLESKTDDPLGEYDFNGPLATGEGRNGMSPNIWAIDMTVLQWKESTMYAIWSGWDKPYHQCLYIAKMESPTKIMSTRQKLCNNEDYLWERMLPDESIKGINEAPQVLSLTSNETDSLVIFFSCGASELTTYKLGMLELKGNDLLDPTSWTKRNEPVFQSTTETYAVGHSSFVQSLDRTQWWHIYQAKIDRRNGWQRSIYVQPFAINAGNDEETEARQIIIFGNPVDACTVLDAPSGEITRGKSFSFSVDDMIFYSHHQYYSFQEGGDEKMTVWLGNHPLHPVNVYRCGEKMVLDHEIPDDFLIAATINCGSTNSTSGVGNDAIRMKRKDEADACSAGVLFRCSGASLGYVAQRAYVACVIPDRNVVMLGKTNGTGFVELAYSRCGCLPSNELQIEMVGPDMKVFLNGKLCIYHSDFSYTSGTVGLRVVDLEANFTNLQMGLPVM